MKKICILLIAILIIFFISWSLSFSQKNINKKISQRDMSIASNTYIHIRELFERLNLLVKSIDREKA